MTVKGFRGNHASRIENSAVRISFPFDDLRGEVVITVTVRDQIDVFPVDAFERYCATEEPRHMERANYFAISATVGPDGLVPIPETLLQFVGLDGEVAVMGCIDHITIIDAQRLADAIAKEEPPDLGNWTL